MDQSKRICELRAKRNALSVRLARAEAEQAKSERRHQTRQKILIGAAVLRALAAGRMGQESFYRLLTENLAAKDLGLFKL